MSLGSYLWSDSQKNISPMNFKAKTTISQNYLRCAASCALCNFSALPTKQAEKVWEYQGAGFGMRFLFALLRPHTSYYAVHAMADFFLLKFFPPLPLSSGQTMSLIRSFPYLRSARYFRLRWLLFRYFLWFSAMALPF